MADLPLRRLAVTLATVLSIHDLAKTYGGVKPRAVFAGVSLELEPGDYVAVMGESGQRQVDAAQPDRRARPRRCGERSSSTASRSQRSTTTR